MYRRWKIHAVWAGLVALVVLLRLPFLRDPLGIDEAGYAIVARGWYHGGPSIYGDLWVDRPPLLILLYRTALDVVPGSEELAISILGLVLTWILVGAIARAAWRLGGLGAAAWAGAVAAAVASTPSLRGQTVNAELPAAALVACSLMATVEAATPTRTLRAVRGWAASAGIAGAAAMLVKQNFVEGLVIGAAWAIGMLVTGRADPALRRRAWAMLGAGFVGALVPMTLVLGWMVSSAGPGIDAAFDALVGFRIDALATISEQSRAAVDERAGMIWAVALTTGLLPLLVVAAVGAVRGVRRAPAPTVAWIAGTGYVCIAIAAGGSWWRHYLIEFAPLVAFAAGVVAARRGWLGATARVTSALVVLVAVATVAVWTIDDTRGNRQQHAAGLVGSTLAASRADGDTAVIFGGHANALFQSGMTTPYPYLWSLPMRVRDPELRELVDTMRGADSPEWFVTWFGANPWGIDVDGELRRTLDEQYRLVAKLCQQRVYLRRDVTRQVVMIEPNC